MDPSIEKRLMAQIPGAPICRRRRPRTWSPAGAACLLALLVGLVLVAAAWSGP